MILANRVPLNVWGGGGYIIGANRAGKSEHVNSDGIKINEQNKCMHRFRTSVPKTEFEAISLLLQKVMLGLNQWGIERCNAGTEQVQDTKMYFTIEQWCSMKS